MQQPFEVTPLYLHFVGKCNWAHRHREAKCHTQLNVEWITECRTLQQRWPHCSVMLLQHPYVHLKNFHLKLLTVRSYWKTKDIRYEFFCCLFHPFINMKHVNIFQIPLFLAFVTLLKILKNENFGLLVFFSSQVTCFLCSLKDI